MVEPAHESDVGPPDSLSEGEEGEDDSDPPLLPTPGVIGTVERDPLQAFIDARVDARVDARLDELRDAVDPEPEPDPGDGTDNGDVDPDPDLSFDGTIERSHLSEELQQLLDKLDRLFTDLDPAEIAALLHRLDTGLDNFETSMGLKAIIGPSLPDDGHPHSTAGWGTVFTTDGPLDLRECQIFANQPGQTVAEIHAYDGDALGLVDSTHITVPKTGAQTIDLDLHVPEAGTYILTRDYQALKDGTLQNDERVALWRTHTDWDGWGRIGNGLLTLETSAHPDFGSEPRLWYYFFDLQVYASTGRTDTDADAERTAGAHGAEGV